MLRVQLLGSPDLVNAAGVRIQSVLAQPKRTALLAWLLLARPRGPHTRDSLVELFWPGLEPERGRTALRKSLHFLRQALGSDVIKSSGAADVQLLRDRITCDVFDLEHAVATGEWRAALATYRGDLLAGLLAHEAPGFGHWLDAERARLRSLALRAASAGADAARGLCDTIAEWHFCEQALAIDPVDEAFAGRVLDLGQRSGDAARALAVFDANAARLAVEFELETDPSLLDAADSLRAAAVSAHAAAVTGAPLADGAAPDEVPPPGESRERQDDAPQTATTEGSAADDPAAHVHADDRRATAPNRPAGALRRAAITTLAAACAVVLLLAIVTQRSSASSTPLFAIGTIRDFTPADSVAAAAMPELLATHLGRTRRIQVIGNARLHELAASRHADAAALSAAARRAGARHIVEGALYRLPDERLRLDIRRIELGTGRVHCTWTVHAADPFRLADAASASLLHDLQHDGCRAD
jgi:DNA-binding SARP family transcriptional activator/TolB-like protein